VASAGAYVLENIIRELISIILLFYCQLSTYSSWGYHLYFFSLIRYHLPTPTCLGIKGLVVVVVVEYVIIYICIV
jgi:hypothetical protein